MNSTRTSTGYEYDATVCVDRLNVSHLRVPQLYGSHHLSHFGISCKHKQWDVCCGNTAKWCHTAQLVALGQPNRLWRQYLSGNIDRACYCNRLKKNSELLIRSYLWFMIIGSLSNTCRGVFEPPIPDMACCSLQVAARAGTTVGIQTAHQVNAAFWIWTACLLKIFWHILSKLIWQLVRIDKGRQHTIDVMVVSGGWNKAEQQKIIFYLVQMRLVVIILTS